METQEFSFIGLPVMRTQLDGGLEVFTVRIESILVYAQMSFRVGSWHDGRHPGIAHFLEHLIYSGPERDDWHPSLRPLIFKGVKGNAGTSVLSTEYHLIGPRALYVEMIKCLANMVFSPMFDAKRVEIERHTIMDENRQGMPQAKKRLRIMRKIFPHVARWQIPLDGTPATIKDIEAEDLLAFHDRLYTSSNACLVVVGDVEHEQVLEAVQKIHMPTGRRVIEPVPDITPKLSRGSIREHGLPDGIELFFDGVKDEADRVCMHYVLDLLDDTDAGLLFKRLRMQDRLVYGVQASSSDFPRGISIHTDISPFHFNYVEEAVFEEVDRIVRGDFPQEYFELLKLRLSISQSLRHEQNNHKSLADRVSGRWLNQDYQDRRATILEVTPEQVGEVAGKYLRRDKYGCLHIFNDPES